MPFLDHSLNVLVHYKLFKTLLFYDTWLFYIYKSECDLINLLSVASESTVTRERKFYKLFFCFLFFSKVEVLFIYKANGCGVFDCHHNHTEIYKKKGERVGEARLHTGERKDSITYKTVINNLIIYGFLWLEASF